MEMTASRSQEAVSLSVPEVQTELDRGALMFSVTSARKAEGLMNLKREPLKGLVKSGIYVLADNIINKIFSCHTLMDAKCTVSAFVYALSHVMFIMIPFFFFCSVLSFQMNFLSRNESTTFCL